MAATLIERLEPLTDADRLTVLQAVERTATEDLVRVSRSLADRPGMELGERRLRLATLVDACRDLCDVVDAHLHYSGPT